MDIKNKQTFMLIAVFAAGYYGAVFGSDDNGALSQEQVRSQGSLQCVRDSMTLYNSSSSSSEDDGEAIGKSLLSLTCNSIELRKQMGRNKLLDVGLSNRVQEMFNDELDTSRRVEVKSFGDSRHGSVDNSLIDDCSSRSVLELQALLEQKKSVAGTVVSQIADAVEARAWIEKNDAMLPSGVVTQCEVQQPIINHGFISVYDAVSSVKAFDEAMADKDLLGRPTLSPKSSYDDPNGPAIKLATFVSKDPVFFEGQVLSVKEFLQDYGISNTVRSKSACVREYDAALADPNLLGVFTHSPKESIKVVHDQQMQDLSVFQNLVEQPGVAPEVVVMRNNYVAEPTVAPSNSCWRSLFCCFCCATGK